jgi:tetratricopeptide (TPR) repeat protein
MSAALVLYPSIAHAQLDDILQSVRDLVSATATTDDTAARIDVALSAWDKHLKANEDRIRQSLRSAPDLRAAQLHIELGVLYRVRGRLADAVREFDASVRLRPSGSDVRVLRALTFEALGRPADAARSFDDAWTLDPRNAAKAYYVASRPDIDTAARGKARGFLLSVMASPAASGFSRTSAAPPPSTPAFPVLDAIPDSFGRTPIVGDDTTGDAFALLADGKYKEAVAALKRARAVPVRRDSPRLHLARGQAAESLNHVPDARREYEASLAGALAGRSIILIAISRLAQVDGDQAGAIDALTRAARLNPNDSLVRHELSAALAAGGRTDDALMELAAALVIDPRDAQAYAAIGQLELDAEHNAEAVAAFTRALELAPNGYELRYALSTAYSRLGNTAEASKELELFDRARRAALEERRRVIATEAAPGQ